MNRFLLDLAALSLGGGAVVLLLLLAARLTRGRYAARWRCTAWLLLSLRLAVPFPLLPHLGPAEAPVQLTVPSNPVVFTYSPPVSQPPAASSRPAQSQAAPSRSEPVQNAVQPEAPAESGGFSLSLAQLLLILWLLMRPHAAAVYTHGPRDLLFFLVPVFIQIGDKSPVFSHKKIPSYAAFTGIV